MTLLWQLRLCSWSMCTSKCDISSKQQITCLETKEKLRFTSNESHRDSIVSFDEDQEIEEYEVNKCFCTARRKYLEISVHWYSWLYVQVYRDCVPGFNLEQEQLGEWFYCHFAGLAQTDLKHTLLSTQQLTAEKLCLIRRNNDHKLNQIYMTACHWIKTQGKWRGSISVCIIYWCCQLHCLYPDASVSILSGTLAENHASLWSQYVGEEKSMLFPSL